MTGKQDAVFVKEIGKPVECGTRDIPSPKEGEVLVKVTVTMILPHDTYGRDWGLLIDRKLPAVLGSNVAGVVKEVGSGVAWKSGQRVFGISSADPTSSDQGGLQEYAVLNANAIGKTPENFSDEQVVTLPINLVTSWTALFGNVLIIGGGTNVGQFGVQLARIACVGKIIVVAGPSGHDRLRSMGATHVIDRHGSPTDIAQQVHEITGPESITQVYSCAQLDSDLVIAALSSTKASRLRALLPIEEEDAEKLRSQRPLCDASFIDDLTNESMGPYIEDFWRQVPQWLTDKKILPTEYAVINGLHQVAEIDDALDAYRDFSRAGPQTVVKIG